MRFLRDHRVKDSILKWAKKQGLDGVVVLLNGLHLPSFTTWRWGKLHDICKGLVGCFRSLAVLEPKLFTYMRDKSDCVIFFGCLRSAAWLDKLLIIEWFAHWLTPVQKWIGSCSCTVHDRDSIDFDPVSKKSCKRKGRLLSRAYPYGCQALRDGVDEAQAWTVESFKLDHQLWIQTVGAARYASDLARKKLHDLDCIPWLLARLLEPGVKEEVLRQFAEAPIESHHPVSLEFLMPGTSMRMHVDDLNDDCDNAHALLLREVESLNNI